jgi:hypothetical protein
MAVYYYEQTEYGFSQKHLVQNLIGARIKHYSIRDLVKYEMDLKTAVITHKNEKSRFLC